ncbi:hypothetical protein HDU85_002428 [Gaertneriomyces sp. JEL0708]|nr:hypothetical protein HDU85_002428 [Gaertneriomyces sp. JEL0708]
MISEPKDPVSSLTSFLQQHHYVHQRGQVPLAVVLKNALANERKRPFIKWLAESFETNGKKCWRGWDVLSKAESEAWKELQAWAGDVDLESYDDDCEEDEDIETIQCIEDDIRRLEQELKIKEEQCKTIERRTEKLEQEDTSLQTRHRNIQQQCHAVDDKLNQLSSEISNISVRVSRFGISRFYHWCSHELQIDAVLSEIASTSQNLQALIENDKAFYCQSEGEIGDYVRAEEEVMDAMVEKYTEELDGDMNESVAKIVTHIIRGYESQCTPRNSLAELHRLIKLYPLTEREHLHAKLRHHEALKKLDNFRAELLALGPQASLSNLMDISEQEAIQTEAAVVRQDIDLLSSEIGEVWDKIATLKLKGGLLKIATRDEEERLNATKTRINEALTVLLRQYARLQMVLSIVGCEHQKLRTQAHLLESVKRELEAVQGPRAEMAVPERNNDQKDIVDGRDMFMALVKQALSDDDEIHTPSARATVSSFSTLVEQARDLAEKGGRADRDGAEMDGLMDEMYDLRLLLETLEYLYLISLYRKAAREKLVNSVMEYSLGSVLLCPKEVLDLEKKVETRMKEVTEIVGEASKILVLAQDEMAHERD